jgi:hypothetical protein
MVAMAAPPHLLRQSREAVTPSSSGPLPAPVGANSRGRSGPLTNPRAVSRHATQDAQSNQALFGTEKTASVHDHHVLAELGVGGRGEAAPIAHRLDLASDHPPLAGRCNRAPSSGARPPGRAPSPGAMEPYPPGGRPPERYVNGASPPDGGGKRRDLRSRSEDLPALDASHCRHPPAVALPSGRAASHRPE